MDRHTVVLLALGAAAAMAGVVWALIAKAAADGAARAAGVIPTLPVGEYRQYTQHLAGPDAGPAIAIAVAAAGVLILVTGLVLALMRPGSAR